MQPKSKDFAISFSFVFLIAMVVTRWRIEDDVLLALQQSEGVGE
jgi:hypothetical protein